MVLLCGCETNEVRAWAARRAELEHRQQELTQLEARAGRSEVAAFRSALDLPGFVREHQLFARVFVEPGVTRLTFSGPLQQCRDTLNALAPLRWLTASWRLRLEQGRCEWEARTGADFVTLEQALLAPPVKWSAPPSQWLSRGVEDARAAVEKLEADLRLREARLGEVALLQGKLEAVQPLIDEMKARPAPCDLAVVDRELALELEAQGALLEVEQTRLVHPLEPRSDFRLRGLVELHDGALSWHCAAL